MGSLKGIRTRILSVKAMRRITESVQVMAMARFRKAQLAVDSAKPYLSGLVSSLDRVLSAGYKKREKVPVLLIGRDQVEVHLLIICTGDRGLCGGFNSSAVRAVQARVKELYSQGKKIRIICVGRKGFQTLRNRFSGEILDHVRLEEVRESGFECAEVIGKKVLDLFDRGDVDAVTLFYSKPHGIAQQSLIIQDLIPWSHPAISQGNEEEEQELESKGHVVYEGTRENIVRELLIHNVSVQIFNAMLDSVAAFYGAQVMSMDNATRNADDMIKRMTIHYNRSRQAAVTQELIEVIAGAEVVLS